MTFSGMTKFYAFKKPWASADFFQEEGKNIQEGKNSICLKNTEKRTIFFQRSLKTYYFTAFYLHISLISFYLWESFQSLTSPNGSEGCWLQGKAMKVIFVLPLTCSYENLSNLQLCFSPNQINSLKSNLTWLGFELKTLVTKTPLMCLNQLSYWNRQEMRQFFRALSIRERDREKEKEREGAQAGQYIHFEHPPPPSVSLSDMPYHQQLIY
jgi:hypothetical protein